MRKNLVSLIPQLPHRNMWLAMMILIVAAQACNS
jgi:hypothetical protein